MEWKMMENQIPSHNPGMENEIREISSTFQKISSTQGVCTRGLRYKTHIKPSCYKSRNIARAHRNPIAQSLPCNERPQKASDCLFRILCSASELLKITKSAPQLIAPTNPQQNNISIPGYILTSYPRILSQQFEIVAYPSWQPLISRIRIG